MEIGSLQLPSVKRRSAGVRWLLIHVTASFVKERNLSPSRQMGTMSMDKKVHLLLCSPTGESGFSVTESQRQAAPTEAQPRGVGARERAEWSRLPSGAGGLDGQVDRYSRPPCRGGRRAQRAPEKGGSLGFGEVRGGSRRKGQSSAETWCLVGWRPSTLHVLP